MEKTARKRGEKQPYIKCFNIYHTRMIHSVPLVRE
jgi:hypothetical protein